MKRIAVGVMLLVFACAATARPTLPTKARKALAVGAMSATADACGACFVWEVKGPNNSTSTQFDLRTTTSCDFPASGRAITNESVVIHNCCDHLGTLAVSGFEDWRAAGQVTGFDKYTCTRTKITVCGTFKSRAIAQQLTTITEDESYYAAVGFNVNDLGAFFDITDDSCPMSLINATLRAYTASTAGTLTDNRCTNRLYVERPGCSQPDRKDSMGDDTVPFPNDTRCEQAEGSTSFRMERRTTRVPAGNYVMSCANITVKTPVDTKSACGKSKTLKRISFWIDEQDKGDIRAVFIRTKDGKRTRAITSWGPKDSNALSVNNLNWTTSFVRNSKPQVCFEMAEYSDLTYVTYDGLGNLWAALYDESEACCPVYWANRV